MKILTKQFVLLFGIIIYLYGCLGGGTHGYIKAYRYDVSKHSLEEAVHQIITENPAIHRDSIKDYYNDDTNYVTIRIIQNGMHYTYTFRYYGGKEYWNTSKTSEIFIAYAYDEKGKGGSSGNGGIKWYDLSFKKKLTELFERELIDKIDTQLGIKHTEEQ